MWRFVSKQPSLWKPGAACPRPSNKAPAQGGAEGIVRGFQGSQGKRERRGMGYSILQAGWARKGRKEAKGQDQAGSKGQKPRDKGRERLAETDKGSPETVKGRDTIRERKTREGGRRQELVRVTETTHLDSWQGRTNSQTDVTPREGKGCAREKEEATGDDRDGWTCDGGDKPEAGDKTVRK